MDITAIKKQFETMKKAPPKQKSKKEIVAELADDIRGLLKSGYGIKDVLDVLRNNGLELQESTLKNYLSRAGAGAASAAGTASTAVTPAAPRRQPVQPDTKRGAAKDKTHKTATPPLQSGTGAIDIKSDEV